MKKITTILIFVFYIFTINIEAQCNDRPIINDFSPKTGFIGSTVTITGANFNATPANNQVFFGATQATVVSSSFGTLEVRVPEGSTTSLISVKNHCNLTAYSKTHFNGIFCPTPLTNTSYQNVSQELGGVYGAYNMISQDMDNDGKPDVVSAGLNGGITIAKNNSTPGSISFSAYNFPTATRTVTAADFDGDGLKDLVTNASILRNISTGPGNFGLAYAIDSRSVSGYQIGAGDFNNDGKVDIIGSNGSGIYIAFNTSTGPGNFNFTSRQFIATTGHCTGIQVADIDGDGKTDFIASQGQYNRAVSIRNTTSNGSLTSSFDAPEYWNSGGSYPYRSMIADFDKDGKIDFTSCNYSGATNTAIWRNTSTVGNISFATTVNLPSPGANYRIGVGDVDGDGYPDIVTKSLGVNVFSVYRNTSTAPGAVSFAARIDYTSSSRAEVSGIVIGDLDGDFVPDIATSGISSNTIRFHRNTGAQNDVTPPTVACRNITVALSPTGTVTITPEMIDNGSGDACGIESLTLSETNFTCANIGENTVTLTATDGAGNVSTCTATVNVQPAAIIVAGQSTVCQGETVEMNANDGDSYQWSNNGVAIAGATSQSYTATASGSYTVNVTNSGGCSGESLPTPVVVNDNPTVDISPSGNAFLCPPNNSTTLTASQSSIYQWMKNGVDIANATQQTYNVTSIGSYSVRVIDLFGCSATSDATVISANPAEIDVTGDGNYGNVFPNQDYVKTITINNTGAGSLDISNLAVTGADAASFALSGFSTPSSIAPGNSATVDITFNAPNITTYTAQLSFNSNDCDEGSFTIPLDAEITCVAAGFSSINDNISANNDEGICGATINYTTEIVGNPTSTLTYTFSGATTGSGEGSGTGSLFSIGTTTVTLNVTNPCGNVTQSFDVTVIDNEPPVIEGENTNLDMNFNAGTGYPASYTEAGITFLSLYGSSSHVHLGDNDNDGSNDILNHSGCCSTPYRLTVGSGTEFTLVSMNVRRVSGNPTFSVFPSGASVTITSTGVFTFPAGFENVTEIRWNQNAGTMVIDDMVVSTKTSGQCPADITVSSDADSCGTNVSFSANATDNCDAAVSFSPASGSFFNVGTTTVTATATDSSNNTSSCTFEVTVEDDVAPVVNTNDLTVELDSNGQASITIEQINNDSSDNCGIASTSLDTMSFDCSNVGTNKVTLTVMDINGNSASGTATVTVVDNIPPIVVTQNLTLQLDSRGNASATSDQVNNGSTDNCAVDTTSLDITNFSCSDLGENTVTLTVTDINGNSATSTAVITIIDSIPPTIITQSYSIDLANGVANISASNIDGGTFDNCDFTLSIDRDSFTCSDIGDHTVTLTATDSSGNTSSGTATVSVVGEIPVISISDFTTVQTQNTNTIYLGFGDQSVNLSTIASGGSSFTYQWTASTGEFVESVANPEISPTTSTTYTVIATNNYGCSTSTSIDVCVMDARSYNKKGKATGKVLVCHHTNGKKGTKHVLISISSDAVMQHLLNHGAETNHGDTLGECGATCLSSTPTIGTVANQDIPVEQLSEFLVYPNPSDGIFYIKLNSVNSRTELTLFDLTGKVVSQKTAASNSKSQNISMGHKTLPAGIYILKIISTEESIVKKLIIKK